MCIKYNNQNGIFKLNTKNSTYAFGVWKEKLYHIYYGKRINEIRRGIEELLSEKETGLSAIDAGLPKGRSSDIMPMEFPTYGAPDLRTPAFGVEYPSGHRTVQLKYVGHNITDGKEQPKGMPGLWTRDGDRVKTLKVVLSDTKSTVRVMLYYTVFYDYDAILRRTVIENRSDEAIRLTDAMSLSYDIVDGAKYDFLHLYGSWGRERIIQRRPLFNGMQSVDSKRGASSPNHNPFFALLEKGADEKKGEVFGINLIYSGNFFGGVELDTYNTARVLMGINPFNFSYKLEKGESFDTPEAVTVYSANGIGEMSRKFHRLFRNNLCRSKFSNTERYVLVNNWEATYFDFSEEKLLKIADEAVNLGIDMLVLDDGWFGKRNDEKTSLGDWFVNTEKLPDGLQGFSRKLHQKGLKFGLWFEPEMVSPDSELYRANPDWAIQTDGIAPSLGRFQMILDLSREDVCNYIINSISGILESAEIDYVKWDMNRHMSEIASDRLPADRQSELPHRYILGLYRIMEVLTNRFPDVLFEGCSSGGGRFDGGILYYMPQIWTSDVSDAVERLKIQYGTSIVYPFSSIGAHVSVVPNHQVGRITPFEMRGNVALMGQFGYELDLSTMTDEEKQLAKEQIALYRRIGAIIHQGDCYRLKNPFEEDLAAFQFVSSDGKNVVLIIASQKATPNAPFERILLDGLDENADYLEEGSDKPITGGELMAIGIPFVNESEHFSTVKIYRKL